MQDIGIDALAALASAPETVNADPEGEGWFAKIKVSDTSTDGLMDRAAYDAFLANGRRSIALPGKPALLLAFAPATRAADP